MPAVAERSAVVREPSTIFEESTESISRSASEMLPSRIFHVVIAPAPIVKTPEFERVASPESATEVAVFEPLPTRRLPEASDASLEKSIAAEFEISEFEIVLSIIFIESTESVSRSASEIEPSTILEESTLLAARSERRIELPSESFE